MYPSLTLNVRGVRNACLDAVAQIHALHVEVAHIEIEPQRGMIRLFHQPNAFSGLSSGFPMCGSTARITRAPRAMSASATRRSAMRTRPLAHAGLWCPMGELRTDGSSENERSRASWQTARKLSVDRLLATAFLAQRK